MATTLHKAAPAARTMRAAVAAAIVFSMAAPAVAAADPVLEWNDIARQLVVVPALTPIEQTRAMAIVHVAIHDAVSGVTREYEQYSATAAAPAGATAEAAAIAAGFATLKGLFTAAGTLQWLTARYLASLESHAVDPSDPGLAFGESVAAGILSLREHDGAALAKYVFVPPGAGSIGIWAPISAAPAAQSLLPGWGAVTPWVLRSGAQFRPDAPPAIGSSEYARDYEELKEVGAEVSAVRTGNQTQIALFWRASPTAIWNPVLTQAIASRQLGVSDTARVAALFYLAASDTSVACWEAKYYYNAWRPQAAIVNGDADGNAATIGDAAWRPLLPMPPHPEYPSGHTANSGAMAAALALLFGDEPGFTITATSAQNAGFVRHWQAFSEGVDEVIDARVYSGIHFRTSDTAGARLGRQVARFVLTHALRPARGQPRQ